MQNYIYCRTSKSWQSDNQTKCIAKLGSTNHIEYRKWWGSTERLYPCKYEWFIIIKNLGKFPTVKSAEYTIYRHSFFQNRHVDNGEGSGYEFFEFYNYDNPLKKVCEILVLFGMMKIRHTSSYRIISNMV